MKSLATSVSVPQAEGGYLIKRGHALCMSMQVFFIVSPMVLRLGLNHALVAPAKWRKGSALKIAETFFAKVRLYSLCSVYGQPHVNIILTISYYTYVYRYLKLFVDRCSFAFLCTCPHFSQLNIVAKK